MRFISHRGNLEGKNPSQENSPSYILAALDKGFDCEIDVWYSRGWWLGHDGPKYKIRRNFLNQSNLWIHCKNISAAHRLLRGDGLNFFWHQNDDISITSLGFLWTFPERELTNSSVCVSFEFKEIKKCYGVCSDEIVKFKKFYCQNEQTPN